MHVNFMIAVSVFGIVALAEEDQVTFAVVRDKIVVPVSLNGVGPYPFIWDLSAIQPVMANEVAGFLQLTPDPAARVEVRDDAGHVTTAAPVQVSEFQVGNRSFRDMPFLVMDLTPWTQLLGTPAAGLFGARVPGAEYAIDFERNLLTVRPGDSEEGLRETDPLTVRLQWNARGQPTVQALVDGNHMRRFVLDTTFGGVVGISEQTLSGMGLGTADAPRLTVEETKEGAPKPAGRTQIRLKSIRVGGAEVVDPVCMVDMPNEEARIGLGFLKHFRVTISIDKGLLCLESQGALSVKDGPVCGCGLSVGHFSEGYWSVWVAKGSPAARAGLVSGARLMEIDGKDMKGAVYAAASEPLAGAEGATVTVTVSQDGERRTVLLALEKLL
jgi:predicted aspartyl protease